MPSQGPLSGGTFANDLHDLGAGISWVDLTNASVSDNAYSSATSGIIKTTRYLKATNFGFSIVDGSIITGIFVRIERRKEFSTDEWQDDNVYLAKAGTLQGISKDAGNWTTTDTYAEYGGDGDLWGSTWTVADINDSGFGVGISAITNTTGEVAFIDHIEITVFYTSATGISNLFTLFIHGHELSNNNITLFESGFDSNSNNFPLIVNGQEVTNNSFTLFSQGLDSSNTNIPLFLHGLDLFNNNIPFFIQGSTIITNNIPLYIYGLDSINNNLTLFEEGFTILNNNCNLFIQGSILTVGDIPLFIPGLDLANNSLTLVLFGNVLSDMFNIFDLFISGPTQNTNNLDLFIGGLEGFNTDNTNFLPLFIEGNIFYNNNIPLYLHNFISENNFLLFISGNPTGAVPLIIDGFDSFNTDNTTFLPLFIFNAISINNLFPLFISGTDEFTTLTPPPNVLPLYIAGPINPTNYFPLFIKGPHIVKLCEFIRYINRVTQVNLEI